MLIVYVLTYHYVYFSMGFPGGSEIKNPPAVQEMQQTRIRPLGQEDPLEEGMATPSSVPGERKLAGYTPQGHKELDMTEATEPHTQTHTHVYILCIYIFSCYHSFTFGNFS